VPTADHQVSGSARVIIAKEAGPAVKQLIVEVGLGQREQLAATLTPLLQQPAADLTAHGPDAALSSIVLPDEWVAKFGAQDHSVGWHRRLLLQQCRELRDHIIVSTVSQHHQRAMLLQIKREFRAETEGATVMADKSLLHQGT